MTTLPSPTRRLTVLYLAALTSIALLSIFGQIVVQWAIQQQSSDALVINLAGRQRMLSQQMSKDALFLEYSSDASARTAKIQELQTALTNWKQVHEGLQHGNSMLGLPVEDSISVLKLYKSIQPDFTAMYQAGQDLVSSMNSGAQPADNSSVVHSDAETILAHEHQFLTGMNDIVGQLQLEAESRVSTLHIVEFILLGVTLVVLVTEALFVFRPATNVLRKNFDEIVALEKAIKQQKQELESGIEQLLRTHVAIANGDFQTRAPLAQDHVLWQIAHSLNNLLARFQSSLQIEATSHKMQIETKQSIAVLQAQVTPSKEKMKLIQDEIMHVTNVIREAKTQKIPMPVVDSCTVVRFLSQELGGNYICAALPSEGELQDSIVLEG